MTARAVRPTMRPVVDRGAEPLGARFRAEPSRRFADAVRLCSGFLVGGPRRE